MELVNEILDDYTKYCRDELVTEFGTYQTGSYDPIYLYQRYKCRIISNVARTVKESSELLVPEKYRSSYLNIKADIEIGNSLKKYQSRKLKSLDYDDDMLSHWGIQHFHLGSNIEHDGFIYRTKELLFVHFNANGAHILGVFNHQSWCDLNLIEIMHNNWLDIMTIYKMDSGMRALTENEYKTLRNKHTNANVIVSDGTEYMNPGMGVTANGSPINSVLNSQKVIHMFNQYFSNIKLNFEHILVSANYQGGSDFFTIGVEVNRITKQLVFKIKELEFNFTLSS